MALEDMFAIGETARSAGQTGNLGFADPDSLRQSIIQSRIPSQQRQIGVGMAQPPATEPNEAQSLEMQMRESGMLDDWRTGPLGYVMSSATAMGAGFAKGLASIADDLGMWTGESNQKFQEALGGNIESHQMQATANVQRAMESSGLVGRIGVQTAQAAVDVALFLAMMKGVGAARVFGAGAKAAGSKTAFNLVTGAALKTAGKRAAFSFVTNPGFGETEEERWADRTKGAAVTFAYMATPGLSGWAKTPITAKAFDFLLNSGVSLTSGQYSDAVNAGIAEAKADGNEDQWIGYVLGSLIPIVGTDAAFSAMTKSLGQTMKQAYAGTGLIGPGGKNAENIIQTFFEQRQSEGKPVPQGWEQMPLDRQLAEYKKYFTEGTRESGLVQKEEAQAAEAIRVQQETAEAQAEQERQARAEELRSPEYGRILFVEGDKAEVRQVQDDLGKEGFAALRSEWVAKTAQAEIQKIVAMEAQRGVELNDAQRKSLLDISLREQGIGDKQRKEIRDYLFPKTGEGKTRETLEQAFDRIAGEQEKAETKVTEVLEKWEADQVLPPERQLSEGAKPVVEEPKVIDAEILYEPERIDGEQQAAWRMATERMAALNTPPKMLTEGVVREEAQKSGLDEPNTQVMVDRLLGWQREQAQVAQRILPETTGKPETEAGKPIETAPETPQAAAGGAVAAQDAQTSATDAQRAVEAPAEAPAVPVEKPAKVPAATPQRSVVRELIEQNQKGVSVKANIKATMKATGKTRPEVKAEFDAMVADGLMSRDPRGQYSIAAKEIAPDVVEVGQVRIVHDASRNRIDLSTIPRGPQRAEARKQMDAAVARGEATADGPNAYYMGVGRVPRKNDPVTGTAQRVVSEFMDGITPMVKLSEFRVENGKRVGDATEKTMTVAEYTAQPIAYEGQKGDWRVAETSEKQVERAEGGRAAETAVGADRADESEVGQMLAEETGRMVQGMQTRKTGVTVTERDGQDELDAARRAATEGREDVEQPESVAKPEDDGTRKRDFKQKTLTKEELAAAQAEWDALSAKGFKVTPAESRRMDALERVLGLDTRYQHGGREPGPVTREEVAKQVEDMARKIKGTFTQDRTSSSVVGTLRQGPMRIMVVNEAYSEEAAGAVKRLHKGKFDYLMFVNPETGMRTTVNHEMGHVLRDVLNKRERELMAKIGYEVDSRDGDERFAQAMETTEGRNALAETLKNAAPAEQSVILRGINRIVDFINTVFGTELKHFGSAREFETLAGGIREFGLLRNIGERAAAARAEAGAREMPVYHGTPHLFAPEGKFKHGRFRLDKIGTGEGNQAYGWGIYFAEKKDTAKGYTSGRGTSLDTELKRIVNLFPDSANKDAEVGYASREIIARMAVDLKAKTISKEWLESLADNLIPPMLDGYISRPQFDAVVSEIRSVAKDTTKPIDIAIPEGSLYRLDIPDDVIPKLLDWDRPVSFKQAADVVFELKGINDLEIKRMDLYGEILNEFSKSNYTFTGEDLYNNLSTIFNSEKKATEFLTRAGILGNTHGGHSKGGTGAKYVIWDQATLDRISMLERNSQALDQIMDKQDGVPPRITNEQMKDDSVRLQEAKKLKDSDIEQILVDRYGRGNIRSAWKASGEKDYMKWRKAEAAKLSTPTADPEVVSKVKAAITNQRQPKEDAFGREKRESKVLGHLRTAATNFSRPVFVADAMGLRDEFIAKSTGGTDAAGKTMVEQHKWEQENSSLAREITKGPRITMNVRVGGDLKKGGIRDKQISITRNEALTYAAIILRKEAAEAAGKEGRAKTIEYGLDRFVLGESVGGNKERVFHFTKAQRDSFMQQIRGDAKMSEALAKIGERMEQTYNAIAPQYRKIHGVDLPKDEYYFHITRDISFLDKRKLNAGEQEKVENAYNLLRQGDTVKGLNPESLGILKKLNYSEAPIIVRNAWDNVRAHSESVAKYLESSEVKDWIDRNILAPEVREILSTTHEGRKQLKYFENLSETAGGQIHRERGAVDQIIGAYLKNATVTRLFNPFVWLKQPMSMPSSIAYFGDARYLKNLYMPVNRAFVKQVRDANGTLAGRAISRSYEALLPNYHGEGKAGDMTGDYGTRFAGIQAKAANFGSKMMGRMDRVAIDHIIMAARQYTMDKSPELKGDAFIAEVGRHAAQATKMTQVATYGIDRTMMERNVQDPWRAMITYMWGARGAQFNLLMHSMNKGFTQHTPEALKAAGLVWLTAGLAQSAQIALVDSIRDGFGTKDDDDDESVNKAYRHGLKIMENMAGTIPLANEFLPAVMGPLYKTIGDDKSVQMQRFRVGKTGPLAGATADIMNIMSVAGDFFTASQEIENAKTAKERQRVMEANASKFKRGRRSLIRLGSEMFGVPVSQITRYIPDID